MYFHLFWGTFVHFSGRREIEKQTPLSVDMLRLQNDGNVDSKSIKQAMLQTKRVQVSSVHVTLVGCFIHAILLHTNVDYKTAIVRIPINQLVFHGMPLTLPKINHPKKKFVFQPSIFRKNMLVSGRVNVFAATALPGWFPLREEPHQAAGVTMAPTYAPSSALDAVEIFANPNGKGSGFHSYPLTSGVEANMLAVDGKKSEVDFGG